jgi:hypothetical protein
LTLPRVDKYSRLSNWLSYQRHGATSLRKDQLELLESINYKTVPLHRDRDDSKWEIKCNQLKQVYDETGGDKVKIKDNALSSWFWTQKNLLRRGKLESSREERLKKLGINLSCRCRKVVKSKKNEEKWQSQFEKLNEYHQVKVEGKVT